MCLSFQKRSIEITYKNNQVAFSRVFLSPEQNFKLHLNKKTQRHQPVLDLDVTNEGLGVSCSYDGSLLIWLTSTGQVRVSQTRNYSANLLYKNVERINEIKLILKSKIVYVLSIIHKPIILSFRFNPVN